MANVTRYDPFDVLGQFDPLRDIDEMLGPRRLRSLFRDLPAEPQIRMDVTEDDGSYRVKAEIPGVRKEDIRIQIDGNNVTVSAEVQRQKEERKGERTLCSERYYGKQSRSFTLRHDVDQARAEARYQDGILELTLPKQSAAAVRELKIQ
jgi:HSP20 family protein